MISSKEHPVLAPLPAADPAPAARQLTEPSATVKRILAFNEGREPERLAIKYQRMRLSPFGFYRGTCHLFYEDLPRTSPLHQGPPVWMCGDLHLENFGSYKADNRLVYFDISDFDEALLGPAPVELARFTTSVLIGAKALGVNSREALTLTQIYLRAYTAALRVGKARWVERPTAKGMVKDLLKLLKLRTRRALLDSRTELVGRSRRLIIDRRRTLPVSEVARARIGAFMRKFASREPKPRFYRLMDVARRIAGTASLGIPRFALLVEGEGSPHANYLLDLKFAHPAAPQAYLQVPHPPAWRNDAERITTIQERMQSIAPALLHPVLVNRQPYVLRELQPTSDRLSLNLWGGKIRRLERVMTTMGEVTAWAHLRSGGRQGSAIIDQMIAFARADGWQQEVTTYAKSYSAKVEEDYKEFCGAFDREELEV